MHGLQASTGGGVGLSLRHRSSWTHFLFSRLPSADLVCSSSLNIPAVSPEPEPSVFSLTDSHWASQLWSHLPYAQSMLLRSSKLPSGTSLPALAPAHAQLLKTPPLWPSSCHHLDSSHSWCPPIPIPCSGWTPSKVLFWTFTWLCSVLVEPCSLTLTRLGQALFLGSPWVLAAAPAQLNHVVCDQKPPLELSISRCCVCSLSGRTFVWLALDSAWTWIPAVVPQKSKTIQTNKICLSCWTCAPTVPTTEIWKWNLPKLWQMPHKKDRSHRIKFPVYSDINLPLM